MIEFLVVWWRRIKNCAFSLLSCISYYGTSQLHHLSVRGKTQGEAALVPLSKSGPVYDVQWQPTKERFAVVHGYMPSNATIFTSPKLEVLFHYEGISMNTCLYSPGNTGVLGLCGFGNISGKVSFYQNDKKEKITEFASENTTQFDWCSDGKHFVAATTTPRLRTDNGFEVVDITGKKLFRLDHNELYEVAFQPLPELSKESKFDLSEDQIKSLQKQTKKEEHTKSVKKFIPKAKRQQMEAQKAAGQTPPGADLEKVYQNKIKGLRKKLKNIKDLKADPSKIVNQEQRDKIKKEAEFTAEMNDLQKKLKEMQA